ncbi:hypothetical protein KP005_19385 [Geomonas nitrogeniifigens]|uniref:Anti-sigma factor NepR domain-containing protein n=1 Tax=Geomonas diazotrophica TaxID=2843197 RepID=A0ABX8JJX3_9BACT|nr:hypothetical protein [Geomonas nitrogeniifigens]QWV97471.1 hypothetical protein KP005_19385 [Geomonas nitrogeniifigens]
MMTTERKSATGGKPAALGDTTTERVANVSHTSHDSKLELRYQQLITDRRVRGYLLERADYLEGRQEQELMHLVDAILTVLTADEPRRLQR